MVYDRWFVVDHSSEFVAQMFEWMPDVVAR